MAYDEKLAARVRVLLSKAKNIDERKMFGGVAYLLDGKMVIGVLNNDLVVRIDPNDAADLLKKPGARPMDFTGKPMKGFLYVKANKYPKAKDLRQWVEISMRYVKTLPNKKSK